MSVNSRNAADYSQKLERYCNARDLLPPEYEVNESDGKFICTVKIRGNGEYSSGNSESEAQAKDYASLVALAEMGLSLLNINEAEGGKSVHVSYSAAQHAHSGYACALSSCKGYLLFMTVV